MSASPPPTPNHEPATRSPVRAASPAIAGGHVPLLDGVRGVAISMVLLFHLIAWAPDGALIDRVAWKLAGFGWTGVDLFFVLSGFLITGILYDVRGSARALRSYVARRILRIAPLYFVYLAVVTIAALLLRDRSATAAAWIAGEQGWWWSYTSNFHIAAHGWTGLAGYVDHLWSLAVEEQFYLLWPFAVLLLARRKLVATCVSCIVLATVVRIALVVGGASNVAPYVLLPARIDGLASGALLAILIRGPLGLETFRSWMRPILVTAAVLCATVFIKLRGFPYDAPLVQILVYPSLAIGFAAMIGGLLSAPPASRIARGLSSPRLGALGRYSYGLYVLHWPVANLLRDRLLPTKGPWPRVFGLQLPAEALFALVAFALALLLAVTSWHLLEQPFLSLKRYFPYTRPAIEGAPRDPAGTPASIVPAGSPAR